VKEREREGKQEGDWWRWGEMKRTRRGQEEDKKGGTRGLMGVMGVTETATHGLKQRIGTKKRERERERAR